MPKKPSDALKRAIAKAGGITTLARSLGLKSHAVINQWGRKRVPAEWCLEIEALTGVRCEELRPDVRWGVLRQRAASIDGSAVVAARLQTGVAK